jgi:DNA polymerase I-like protein with 3'-5' exonuclease and polymerase domains/uracil-DNA glycosylase
LIVADQPDAISSKNNWPQCGHAGRVIKNSEAALKRTYSKYKQVTTGYMYAAQCIGAEEGEEPSKDVLSHCSPLFNTYIGMAKPKVIVAMGAVALRQLGFKQKHKDVRGRWLTHVTTGIPVMVTFSQKAVMAAPGIFETFKKDIENAYEKVTRQEVVPVTLETLAATYDLPTTVDDAIAVCKKIIDYAQEGATADATPIAVDTETTTLYPEKADAKIIAFCFSWGRLKSTAILLDHPNAPEEYKARLPEVRQAIAEVLACPKPKILHNAKFDLKFIERRYGMPVANVQWDTLLGEHLLDEDKKGNYGLKPLTAAWLPEYCGYEDHLYELLKQKEGLSQLEAATIEVEHLQTVLGSDHPEYLKEMQAYREALLAYEKEMKAYERSVLEYQWALEDYAFRIQYLDGMVAAWNVEMAHWKKSDKKTRGKKLPKPKRWFYKPRKEFTRPVEPDKPKDPRSKKEKQISTDAGFENVPIKDLQIYGAVDTDVTRQLARVQIVRIAAEKSRVKPLMGSHAIPASRVLGRMEFEGTKIDLDYVQKLDAGLREIVDRTKSEVYSMAESQAPSGTQLNLNNPATLGNVLFNWGWVHPNGNVVSPYPILQKTKTGQASTSEKILRTFVAYEDKDKKVPTEKAYFVERFLLFRKASKALNTFLASTVALSKRDGYLHTQFHLNGTGTGRLSSSDMNMQNIPKYLAGWNIKKLFVPDSDDYVMVNVDYKGAEVRVFTAYARDESLIKALNEGYDMHCFFAHKVFQRPYETYAERDNVALFPDPNFRKLLSAERDQIKRVVFGILYGAGENKIAETIGITVEEAAKLIRLLYDMFPALEKYALGVEDEVLKNKYVETYFGRRRRFPLANIIRYQGRGCRQARNFKIQSTSSDIVIGQLIEMDEPLRRDMGGRLLLTVHDSLVFQFPKKKLSQLQSFVDHYAEKRVKEKYDWLPVPFKADISVGPNYGECQPLDEYLRNNKYVDVSEGIVEENEILNELRDAAFEGEA